MSFPEISDATMRRYDASGPRYTSYPTVPVWKDMDPEVYGARLEVAASASDPLSMYVHLPFCKTHCTYCGCNVVITKDQTKADQYIDQLCREFDLVAERLGDRRHLSQLHWGGGTPTFLDERQIQRLWTEITDRFTPLDDSEIAIEVEPMVTSDEQMRLLRELGFNRLSLGVQDFDERVLASVNREQTYERVGAIRNLARELGFSGVNFDLIYGLPEQSPETWSRTLDRVLELEPDRLAVYSFAYLPDLRKNQRKLPVISIPTSKVKLELFRRAYSRFVDAGYIAIGMDHFARPDDELARARETRTLGRNFQGYTVQSTNDSIAFGASGISDIAGLYAQNLRGLTHYKDRVLDGRLATTRGIDQSDEDRLRRKVITSLMCNDYVDLGGSAAHFSDELGRLRPLEDDGLVRIDGAAIELTEVGRVFVRNVAMAFDTYLSGDAAGATFSRTI